MTTAFLASWCGVDSRGPSSAYILSKGAHASTTTPDLFLSFGDDPETEAAIRALDCTSFTNLTDPGARATAAYKAVEALMPVGHLPSPMFHVFRIGEGMAATFYAFFSHTHLGLHPVRQVAWENDPFMLGLGTDDRKGKFRSFLSELIPKAQGTSRTIVGSYCLADPDETPTLVGLYRVGFGMNMGLERRGPGVWVEGWKNWAYQG